MSNNMFLKFEGGPVTIKVRPRIPIMMRHGYDIESCAVGGSIPLRDLFQHGTGGGTQAPSATDFNFMQDDGQFVGHALLQALLQAAHIDEGDAGNHQDIIGRHEVRVSDDRVYTGHGHRDLKPADPATSLHGADQHGVRQGQVRLQAAGSGGRADGARRNTNTISRRASLTAVTLVAEPNTDRRHRRSGM